MDPLRELCEIKDSFHYTQNTDNFVKKTYFNYKKDKNLLNTPVSPRTLRNQLREIKQKEKDLLLPLLEEIPIQGKFPYRNTYVMADLDLSFNFTQQSTGYLLPQNLDGYTYAVLNQDLGVLDYLKYRLPYSEAHLEKPEAILKTRPEGVDMVFSTSLDYKGDLASAIKICKLGGTFISKIDSLSLNLLYITSLIFDKFSLFQPFLDSHSFVIAEGYKGGKDYIGQQDFIELSIPDSFSLYIQKFISTIVPKLKNYNLYKCKALMNIE